MIVCLTLLGNICSKTSEFRSVLYVVLVFERHSFEAYHLHYLFQNFYLLYRYNMTNTEEPYFAIESLEALSLDTNEDRAYKAVIFAV